MNVTKVVRYCAAEVLRQKDGPEAVGNMYAAWEYIVTCLDLSGTVTIPDISKIGGFVMGERSYLWYRNGPAVFNQGSPALDPQHIKRQMELLVDNQKDITPNGFCHRFLEIHPFQDGNGRVASLLYNWKSGSLMNPVPLPEFSFV